MASDQTVGRVGLAISLELFAVASAVLVTPSGDKVVVGLLVVVSLVAGIAGLIAAATALASGL